MTAKRFTLAYADYDWWAICDKENPTELGISGEDVVELLNELHEENKRLKNRLKDWHQRTFEAHEYFNILEKVIDEVCDDDISNQIWKEYEKEEKLIE